MSQVAMWVSMLRSCLLPLERLEAQLVDSQHLMAGFFALHICVDSTPRELLKLSFHVIQQLVLDLETSGLFGGSLFALKAGCTSTTTRAC